MSDIPKTLPGQTPLAEHDPELLDLIKCEKERQRSGLELIASENFTSLAVNQCLGSCLTNKYSEGLPGGRYYGGQQFIDKVQHALEVSHGLHEQRLAESTRDARLALLSPKEKAILDEVIKGLSSKEIAQQQGLSARTVENHRARIMEKLRAKSVVDLVREFK